MLLENLRFPSVDRAVVCADLYNCKPFVAFLANPDYNRTKHALCVS